MRRCWLLFPVGKGPFYGFRLSHIRMGLPHGKTKTNWASVSLDVRPKAKGGFLPAASKVETGPEYLNLSWPDGGFNRQGNAGGGSWRFGGRLPLAQCFSVDALST